MRSKAIVCALVAAAVFSCSAAASAESYSFFDHYSKLMGLLSSYSDEYFKDNAVIFGDGNASSGSVKIGDPKIYTGYGNIYLNVTCKYEGACTDDCCYFAAVAETDKKSLGCEKAAPNVIWRCKTVYITE